MGAGAMHPFERLLSFFRAEARALVTIISVSPMIALSGVRSSWLMLAQIVTCAG